MLKQHKLFQILQSTDLDFEKIKQRLEPWRRSIVAAIVTVVLWHAITPSPYTMTPKMAVVDLQDITQTFIGYMATQNLNDEQSSQWLHVFSRALKEEIDELSKTHVLLSANQVVSELEDYTPEVKERISKAIAGHVKQAERWQ